MSYEPTRKIMTAAELREAQAGSHGRDYSESDDGYGDMEAEGKRGWEVIPAWGRDGWDLGAWPYVSVLTRIVNQGGLDSDGKLVRSYELMQICEGDRTVYRFSSQGDRDAAIDYLFLWYAAEKDWAPVHDRAALDAGTVEVDARFRGPCHPSRWEGR